VDGTNATLVSHLKCTFHVKIGLDSQTSPNSVNRFFNELSLRCVLSVVAVLKECRNTAISHKFYEILFFAAT
jgi:hypothetical protein